MKNILPLGKFDESLDSRLSSASNEEIYYYFDELISWFEDLNWGNAAIIGKAFVKHFDQIKDKLKRYLSYENQDEELKQNILSIFFYDTPLKKSQWKFFKNELICISQNPTDFMKI